jgi:hypothetical protein
VENVWKRTEEWTDNCLVRITLFAKDNRIIKEFIEEHHEPRPIIKHDKWGTYDEVVCKKCGKFLFMGD